MNFGFTKEETDFKNELHGYLLKAIDANVKHECEHYRIAAPAGPYTKELLAKMGEKRWLAPSWPREYGGLGYPDMFRSILIEELDYFGMRPPMSLAIVGPTIFRHGSPAIKAEYLPRIANGSIHFAIGYSEAQAGSDLGGIETHAKKENGTYTINGGKLYTSHFHVADYIWLLVVTDRNAKPRLKGMSLLIVDVHSPGISSIPLLTMCDERTNQIFLDNVVVPVDNLVGQENRGFYYLLEDLEYERAYQGGAVAGLSRIMENIKVFLNSEDGSHLKSNPLVRAKLAELSTEIEVGRLMYWKVASMLNANEQVIFEGSVAKVFGSELTKRLANFMLDITGLYGLLESTSDYAVLSGKPELFSRQTLIETIWAGANEICRSVISNRALGLGK